MLCYIYLTVCLCCTPCPQAATYKFDFEQERSDREKAMGRFEEERETLQANIAKLNEQLRALQLKHDDTVAQLRALQLKHDDTVAQLQQSTSTTNTN